MSKSGFKTGDKVSYYTKTSDSPNIVTGILLGVAAESGPVRTWIVQFEDPAVIQTDKGQWRGAVVPECILIRADSNLHNDSLTLIKGQIGNYLQIHKYIYNRNGSIELKFVGFTHKKDKIRYQTDMYYLSEIDLDSDNINISYDRVTLRPFYNFTGDSTLLKCSICAKPEGECKHTSTEA